jgi:sialate O-acetylesterase
VKLSPEIIATEIKDGTIIFTLDQPIQAGQLFEFEIAGPDGVYHNAEANGNDNIIEVKPLVNSTYSVPSSGYSVRYAWKDNPLKANVRSLDGLPMSSFEIKL